MSRRRKPAKAMVLNTATAAATMARPVQSGGCGDVGDLVQGADTQGPLGQFEGGSEDGQANSTIYIDSICGRSPFSTW